GYNEDRWLSHKESVRLRRQILLVVMSLLLATLACTAEQREALQSMGAVPPGESSETIEIDPVEVPTETPTPGVSVLTFPTAEPTVTGLMATMTAIVAMVDTPVLEAPPYEIVYRGNPLFIEFYAWW
ncbi:MAG: hypothetical protein JXQ72_07250, partial [Anaerolineae bacterium]|nr:hypothetical protein [Anaerolineae bacterium]